ncbi:MAG: type II toxin-antitoxin system Phd/YefM family antitoxin [Clostridiales bacterium]|nr:type II toxin-antitoxin system Phd/YefM family antitoxin [Clostridiales bacterium]
MININITNFRKELYSLLENAIKFKETINISTKNGNAVVMSEDEYNGLMETLYLCSIPGMEEKIIDGLNTPLEECLSEDEVDW